jgi:hypothetical protein
MFVLCGVQCLLHGMEIVENGYNKQILEIVAYNLPRGDYKLRHALQLTNSTCNRMIETACREYKKEVEEYIQKNKDELPQVTGAKSWNKDFSKCAWVTYRGDAAVLKVLQLTLVGKCDNQIITRCTGWEGFYFPIFEENLRPFFDKDGRASFYGYGRTRTWDGSYRSFAQYCFDLDGNESRYPCYFYCYRNPDNESSYYGHGQSLHILLQYPVLAKAFLQSTKMRIAHSCKYDRVKEFYITGVTIPENYKFFEKSVELEQVEKQFGLANCRRFTRYDSLDPAMRKAIDDQYTKQQAEKNKQNVQEK